MYPKKLAGLLVACVSTSIASAQITIPTVPIGIPGNAPDPTTGFGSVAYTYNIGTTEVTNSQDAEILNARAKSLQSGQPRVHAASEGQGMQSGAWPASAPAQLHFVEETAHAPR